MLELNRLDITGEIDENTPIIVIIEILQSHQIIFDENLMHDRRYINKVLDEITIIPKKKISYPYNNMSLRYIATYVNPDLNIEWTESTLLEAFDFLQNFKTETEIYNTFKCGLQTPEETMNINNCVLYRLCRIKNLLTFRNTTTEQMACALKMYLQEETVLKNGILDIIDKLNKKQIINMFISSQSQSNTINFLENIYPKDIVNMEGIMNAYNEIGKSNTKRILPRTQCECVVLGILNYNIDLSTMFNPYKEYHLIMNDEKGYVPSETASMILYKRNKLIYDIRFNFNPMIPIELYDEEALREMVNLEGYENLFYKDIYYENLQISYFSKTFYFGYYPKIYTNKTSILYEDIDDMKYENLVSYGIKDEKLYPFTWNELTRLFLANKNFINPLSGEFFDSVSLKKLKNLCIYKFEGIDVDSEIERDRIALFKAISLVEFENGMVNEKVNILRLCYLKLQTINPASCHTLKIIIKCIFEIGMYMRGWDGNPDSYPISDAPITDLLDITLKLQDEFIKLESLIESLKNINVDIDINSNLYTDVIESLSNKDIDDYLNKEYDKIIDNLKMSPIIENNERTNNEMTNNEMTNNEMTNNEFSTNNRVSNSDTVSNSNTVSGGNTVVANSGYMKLELVNDEQYKKSVKTYTINLHKLINKLPLLKFKSGIFHISEITSEGLTLLERIEIVKKGENSDNTSSCIRLSSNWIVSSGYCFLQAINETPTFNLSNLSYIH